MFDASPPSSAPSVKTATEVSEHRYNLFPARCPEPNMPRLHPHLKKMWLEALRSGRFKQARGVLGGPGSPAHCALGVLSDVMGYPDMHSREMVGILEALHFKNRGEPKTPLRTIIAMNDTQCASFQDIANYIEWRL